MTSMVAAPIARYLVSVDNHETVGCFLALQLIRLRLKNSVKPIVDFAIIHITRPVSIIVNMHMIIR